MASHSFIDQSTSVSGSILDLKVNETQYSWCGWTGVGSFAQLSPHRSPAKNSPTLATMKGPCCFTRWIITAGLSSATPVAHDEAPATAVVHPPHAVRFLLSTHPGTAASPGTNCFIRLHAAWLDGAAPGENNPITCVRRGSECSPTPVVHRAFSVLRATPSSLLTCPSQTPAASQQGRWPVQRHAPLLIPATGTTASRARCVQSPPVRFPSFLDAVLQFSTISPFELWPPVRDMYVPATPARRWLTQIFAHDRGDRILAQNCAARPFRRMRLHPQHSRFGTRLILTLANCCSLATAPIQPGPY